MKKFSMIFMLLVTGLSVSACSVATNEKQQGIPEAAETQEQGTGNTAGTEKNAESENTGSADSIGKTDNNAGEQDTVEEDMVEIGQSCQISGYELVDGDSLPVTVTFTLKDVLRGDEAYWKLVEENSGLAQAPEGMEYVVADIGVSYDEGEAEILSLAKNEASLPSAKLYFALSNGDSNGEDLTEDMEDSIYRLELQREDAGEGTVVFLHDKDSEEPLHFTGFDNVIKFDIKK